MMGKIELNGQFYKVNNVIYGLQNKNIFPQKILDYESWVESFGA